MTPPRRSLGRRLRRAVRRRLTPRSALQRRAQEAEQLAVYERGFAPGHFYSPLPDLGAVAARADVIWGPAPRQVDGVALHEADQLDLLERLGRLTTDHPWADEATAGLRYRFDNDYYRHADVLTLLGLLRLEPPRRVIEVGSGFSSAALLDVNDRFLGGRMQLTFIEPYPERLRSLLRPTDDVEVVEEPVERVDPRVFDGLGAGDVLLVDSSHVLKVDSDVCHLLFRVLPRLAPGVRVHFHDIHWPFEYPQAWVMEGRAWNEAYAVRAFLSYNHAFRVELFGAYLGTVHADAFRLHVPAAGGAIASSLWLRRTAVDEPRPS